jgi:hypothetical protein
MDSRKLIEMDTSLDYFKKELEEIVAAWDGKDSGLLEDRAVAAKELQEKCDEMRNLIAELI